VLAGDQLNDFLDDMVAVLVSDNIQNIRLQLLCELGLLLNENMLQRLDTDISLGSRDGNGCSIATFCTTRQAYICVERSITFPFITPASTFF
jgi:hypothetical protein